MTLLDANHCPGAAMFLFRNVFTGCTTLHVGDFRWHRATMMPQITAQLRAGQHRWEREAQRQQLKRDKREESKAMSSSSSSSSSFFLDTEEDATTEAEAGASSPAVRLDYLFLDTTYCDASRQFPSQQEVIDAAVSWATVQVPLAMRAATEEQKPRGRTISSAAASSAAPSQPPLAAPREQPTQARSRRCFDPTMELPTRRRQSSAGAFR